MTKQEELADDDLGLLRFGVMAYQYQHERGRFFFFTFTFG